jgi:chromosome segregation ATPase
MKVEDQLALLLTKMDEQSKTISEGNRRINDVYVAVEDLRAVKADLETWRPKVDEQVADLRDCVTDLRQQLDALQSSPSKVVLSGSTDGKVLASAHLGASSSKAASGLLGHGVEHSTGALVRGVFTPTDHLRSKV